LTAQGHLPSGKEDRARFLAGVRGLIESGFLRPAETTDLDSRKLDSMPRMSSVLG
jgi:hypothetical protein